MHSRRAALLVVCVPLSGAVGARFDGDIVLPLIGRDLCVQVKVRADGFRELYSWLSGRDVLIAKADRQEPLVIATAVAGCGNCQTGRVVMPRRPAQITQAEVARIILAAEAGWRTFRRREVAA